MRDNKACECLACDRKYEPAAVCWRCYNRERLEAQKADVLLEKCWQILNWHRDSWDAGMVFDVRTKLAARFAYRNKTGDGS